MAKKERVKKKRGEQSNVLHSIAGSLEEAFSEDVSEISEDDVIVVDVPEKPHRKRGKRIASFAVGLLVLVFAVVGIVNTVIGATGIIGDIANNTALKNEFALYLYPVVATDPPSFEKTETLTDSVIIKAAISRILLTGDTSNYNSDMGIMYIPEFDVETNAKNIFGNSVTFEHQTVGHVEDLATYFPEKKAYMVANSSRLPNYFPVVTEVSNVGETYTLTVEYYPPSVSIPGLDREQTAAKTMTYVIAKSGDKKMITSIAINKVTDVLQGNSSTSE